MLRKLFDWIAKSTNAPSPGSPRDVDVVDAWASLPTDLLLEVVLRLEGTTVVRCACVCKPWRRAIVGNAASLRRRRPHLDGFDPSLLLGIFHVNDSNETWLRRTPAPSLFQSALPSNGSGGHETVESLIPAASASAAGAIRGLYSELLSSRDGYILLKARIVDRLCLCNPITGDCTFLYPPAPYADCVYVLLTTGHDDLSPPGAAARSDDDMAVRILAVKRTYNSVSNEGTERLTYQVFSTSGGSGDGGAAGTWGPVKRSHGEMEQAVCPWMRRRSTVVCHGAVVYWLAGRGGHCYITGTLALDVNAGRTWTTELPKQGFGSTGGIGNDNGEDEEPMLATSSDGRRLSLIRSLRGPQIQVWVLVNDDVAQWNLQHTISIQVQNLLPHCLDHDILRYMNKLTYLSAFCPKSGCVVGMWLDKVLLIDVERNSRSPVRCIGNCPGSYECCPYEMDCSLTYVSKMKHF